MIVINISKDFSEVPDARYISDGMYSGQEFRDKILSSKYEEARAKSDKLRIELDGGYGYPTSFLEEAFGGLARKYENKEVLDTLVFVSNDEPSLIDEITDYIKQAREKHMQ